LPTNRLAPTTNNHLKKEHCMDDIDREIKLVQLQRERLALEREMASKDAAGTATKAAKTIIRGITGPFRVISQWLKRVWKIVLTILILAVGIKAGLDWKEGQERKARDAIYIEKMNHWNAGLEKFKNQECPEATYACSTSGEWAQKDPSIAQYICSRKAADRALCSLRAMTEYTRSVPKPGISND
jgi:hypothetical protein